MPIRSPGLVARWLRLLCALAIVAGALAIRPHDHRARVPTLHHHDRMVTGLPLSPANDQARQTTGVDLVNSMPYNLTGAGVIVMTMDASNPRITHQDLAGRAEVDDSDSSVSAHATHVACTIAGSGAASGGLHAGMAPGATVRAYALTATNGHHLHETTAMESYYETAITAGQIDLANNSLNINICQLDDDCALSGDYGLTSQVMDAVAHGDVGHSIPLIWAAGNQRNTECSDDCAGTVGGPDALGFTTITPPACAKNSIVVGAVYSDTRNVTDSTSFGPCDDGRIKPDLVAPGGQASGDLGITSCSSLNDTAYMSMSGTSSAAAVVTGITALLLEDIRAQYPHRAAPQNATVKALFAQTAEDRGRPGPDFEYGFGLVQAAPADDVLRAGQFAERQINAGELHTFTFDVAPEVEVLRTTLAWDDPPAVGDPTGSLINDLDLKLISPDGQSHYPFTLDPALPLAPAVQSQADHTNNVEQVLVDNPQAGTWQVEVRAFSVPQGPQRYAIAGDGAAQTSLYLTNPLPTIVVPDVPRSFLLDIVAHGESIVPASAKLFVDNGGGSFVSSNLVSLSGTRYRAALPGFTCGAAPRFYLSVEGEQSGITTLPANAPEGYFELLVGSITEILADDFESDTGWTVQNDLFLVDGTWERGEPVGNGSYGDPTEDFDAGTNCFLTANRTGNADVDDGKTWLISPRFAAPSADVVVECAVWYVNSAGPSPNEDIMRIEVSNNDGADWTLAETLGPQTAAGWSVMQIHPADYLAPTADMRIRFEASDLGEPSLVEAAVDAFRVTELGCDGSSTTGSGDFDGDGDVDLRDLSALARCFGQAATGPCQPGDLQTPETVDLQDVNVFLTILTGPQ